MNLATSPEAQRAPWKGIAIITLIGVALRAVLLAAALPLDIQSDEANYIYTSLGLLRFDVYFDQHRYFWPPGYPWLLSHFLDSFGFAGLNVMRGVQVALSGVIGATTMLFAWRMFSSRAAYVAGALWVVFLPMAAFTHFLWTETVFLTIFLPALWNLLAGMDRGAQGDPSAATRRLIIAGGLFGAALYIKLFPLFFLPLAALLVAWRALADSSGAKEAFRRAILPPLCALVVILPWTLRNQEVYGRTVLGGATLGENVYVSLNARYFNFDMLPLLKPRAAAGPASIVEIPPARWTEPPSSWEREDRNGDGVIDPRDAAWDRADEVPHAIDRHGVQIRRGLEYAVDNPSWFARTRIKKWSEMVAPVSFFTRHLALGKYPAESTLSGTMRRPAVVAASGLAALTMLLGIAGFFLTLRRGAARQLIALLFAYMALSSLLVGMSRIRMPFEPFLLVLSAGILSHGPAALMGNDSAEASSRIRAIRIAGVLAFGAGLLALWWISWPEVAAQLRLALRGSGGEG